MKVLLINVNIGVGSVGRIVEDLYYGIINSGNECKIAYGRVNNANIPKEDLFQIGSLNEIRFHALISRFTDRVGFYSYFGTKKLLEFIEEYKPDIIHMHGNYGYYINVKLLFEYIAKKDIMVINTLHSCWDFTGHCCYFTYANCDKWKEKCFNCPQKRAYPTSYLIDNSKNNYKIKKKLFTSLKKQIIVTPSKWLANLCKESFLSKYPIKVINNGIDLNTFKKIDVDLSKYGIDKNKKIILGVSSGWEERKGIKDFFEIAELVDDSYQIVMVGLKKEQLKKLPKNIIGITRTDSKAELAGIYSAATVLFNPTYEDNYPTVNLEAIACGTPVITYNTGGSPEFIEKCMAGNTIDYKDFDKLLDITKKIKNEDLMFDFSSIEYFSYKRMINDYLHLYAEV